MSVTINTDQLTRVEQMLGHIPGAANKAASNAINRAVMTARTEASKKIREMYYINQKAIYATMTVIKASPSNPVARIKSKSGPIPLIKFKVKPTSPYEKQGSETTRVQKRAAKKRRGSPVIARVKKGGGGEISHAFIAKMKSGHVGVFEREGKTRKPMDQLYGPSITQMLGNPSVIQYIEAQSLAKLDERITHEIKRVLDKEARS